MGFDIHTEVSEFGDKMIDYTGHKLADNGLAAIDKAQEKLMGHIDGGINKGFDEALDWVYKQLTQSIDKIYESLGIDEESIGNIKNWLSMADSKITKIQGYSQFVPDGVSILPSPKLGFFSPLAMSLTEKARTLANDLTYSYQILYNGLLLQVADPVQTLAAGLTATMDKFQEEIENSIYKWTGFHFIEIYNMCAKGLQIYNQIKKVTRLKAIKEAAAAGYDEALAKANEVKEQVDNQVNNVKDKVDDAKDKVDDAKDKVDDAKDKVDDAKDKVDDAKDKAEETLNDAKDTVDDAKDTVDDAKDKAEDLKEKGNDTANDAKDLLNSNETTTFEWIESEDPDMKKLLESKKMPIYSKKNNWFGKTWENPKSWYFYNYQSFTLGYSITEKDVEAKYVETRKFFGMTDKIWETKEADKAPILLTNKYIKNWLENDYNISLAAINYRYKNTIELLKEGNGVYKPEKINLLDTDILTQQEKDELEELPREERYITYGEFVQKYGKEPVTEKIEESKRDLYSYQNYLLCQSWSKKIFEAELKRRKDLGLSDNDEATGETPEGFESYEELNNKTYSNAIPEDIDSTNTKFNVNVALDLSALKNQLYGQLYDYINSLIVPLLSAFQMIIMSDAIKEMQRLIGTLTNISIKDLIARVDTFEEIISLFDGLLYGDPIILTLDEIKAMGLSIKDTAFQAAEQAFNNAKNYKQALDGLKWLQYTAAGIKALNINISGTKKLLDDIIFKMNSERSDSTGYFCVDVDLYKDPKKCRKQITESMSNVKVDNNSVFDTALISTIQTTLLHAWDNDETDYIFNLTVRMNGTLRIYSFKVYAHTKKNESNATGVTQSNTDLNVGVPGELANSTSTTNNSEESLNNTTNNSSNSNNQSETNNVSDDEKEDRQKTAEDNLNNTTTNENNDTSDGRAYWETDEHVAINNKYHQQADPLIEARDEIYNTIFELKLKIKDFEEVIEAKEKEVERFEEFIKQYEVNYEKNPNGQNMSILYQFQIKLGDKKKELEELLKEYEELGDETDNYIDELDEEHAKICKQLDELLAKYEKEYLAVTKDPEVKAMLINDLNYLEGVDEEMEQEMLEELETHIIETGGNSDNNKVSSNFDPENQPHMSKEDTQFMFEIVWILIKLLKIIEPVIKTLASLIENYKINKAKCASHALNVLFLSLVNKIKDKFKNNKEAADIHIMNTDEKNFYTIRTYKFYKFITSNLELKEIINNNHRSNSNVNNSTNEESNKNITKNIHKANSSTNEENNGKINESEKISNQKMYEVSKDDTNYILKNYTGEIDKDKLKENLPTIFYIDKDNIDESEKTGVNNIKDGSLLSLSKIEFTPGVNKVIVIDTDKEMETSEIFRELSKSNSK